MSHREPTTNCHLCWTMVQRIDISSWTTPAGASLILCPMCHLLAWHRLNGLEIHPINNGCQTEESANSA